MACERDARGATVIESRPFYTVLKVPRDCLLGIRMLLWSTLNCNAPCKEWNLDTSKWAGVLTPTQQPVQVLQQQLQLSALPSAASIHIQVCLRYSARP